MCEGLPVFYGWYWSNGNILVFDNVSDPGFTLMFRRTVRSQTS